MSGNVLIVDDSLTVRMHLVEAFGAAGFRPLSCGDAREARAILSREQIDAVILDVILPDADGIELLAEVRNSRASCPAVLVLSTESEVKDRIRGLRMGADEYVGKPFDTAYVIARVREILRRREFATRSTASVLVIDDSATFRETLRETFEARGYAVLTAETGEDGLRIAAGQRPDAIVVDGVLPGIDGATVIRSVRLDAALRGTPCLLLTAAEDRNFELRALDSGADAFVRKEEGTDVILAKLGAVLRGSAVRAPAGETSSLLGPKKILAVDDSLTYLHALSSLLQGEGYDVICAQSGEEALELLAVEPVDCVLLDLIMPGLGGEATCRQIKSAAVIRDIPVVMLTALEDRSAMIKGLSAGADDYVPKSSEFEVLKARVRVQLRRKQYEDENRTFRAEIYRREIEAAEARAARQTAEARAAFVEQLEQKNKELEAFSLELAERSGLLDLTHDSIVVCDMNFIISYWNRGSEELYGWVEDDAIGESCVELLHTIFPKPVEEIRAELLETDRWEGELTRTKADGVQVIVASRWSVRRDEQRCPVAILESSNDITGRKRREQEVQALNHELAKRSSALEASNKELEAFAYSVSHDLRAPLRHLAGFGELLHKSARASLNEKSAHYVTMIQEAAHRMGSLIDDLLAFSRISRAEAHSSIVSLEQLAQEAVAEVRQEANGRNIVWKINPLPVWCGDRSMLRLAMVNLISNAVKFTRTRSQAEIEVGCTEEKEDHVVLFVRDNGVGFDMKYYNKLFGVFQRLHPQRAFEGTGIGLATVQRIVHRHGGRVWAEGIVDRGATFYLSLSKITES